MAYPLTLSLSTSIVVPVPASPLIRRAAEGRLIRLGLLLAVGWAVATGVFAFFSPTLVFVEDFAVNHLAVVFAVVFGGGGGLLVMPAIGSTLACVFGYGRVLRRYGGNRMTCPVDALPIRGVIALSGITIGLAAAAVGRIVAEDFVFAAVAVALLVLSTFGAVRARPKAVAAWRGMRAERSRQAAIVAGGDHVVGRVSSIRRPSKEWVNSQPTFFAELAFEYRGIAHSFTIEIIDYPVWAPTDGNEFDLWIDPAGPVGPRRIMVQRRYVGQRFVADPTAYRSPGENDSGPGPIAPPWMSGSPDKADKMTLKAAPLVRFILALPPVLVAATTVAAAILAPIQVHDVSTVSQWLLWLYAAANLNNAVFYLLYQARSRWLVRNGLKLALPNVAAASSLIAAIGAIVSSPALFNLLEPDDEPWAPAHIFTMVSVIGSLLVFAWTFVSMDRTVRHFNGETPAPAEAVQEALTSHDPQTIDDLENRYGYRAGAFLMHE